MQRLTQRQQQILDFIQASQVQAGVVPTLREIAHQFGFRSMTAAADHVRALRRKGFLAHHPRMARSHGVVAAKQSLSSSLAGFPAIAESLGLPSSGDVFAVKVRGDSMVERHILDGDVAMVERGATPKPGDVVAVQIDGETTLKTFDMQEGWPVLRAENPLQPDLVRADKIFIQGVMVGLVRPARQFKPPPEAVCGAAPASLSLATSESSPGSHRSTLFSNLPAGKPLPEA